MVVRVFEIGAAAVQWWCVLVHCSALSEWCNGAVSYYGACVIKEVGVVAKEGSNKWNVRSISIFKLKEK